ncbi:MAG: lysophospholipid acyltransferase family protein [Deltaproteobacteria bacterium]|nr:lysophospholipid acyltransferase family protein [Deltaproteobacteria bacterium]
MSESRIWAARGVKKRLADLWLNVFGWKVEGGAPDIPKAVVVAAPHTSYWDLPFTLAVAWSLGVQVKWLGKHTLFRPPFRTFFRALGGIAVDRRDRHDLVPQVVRLVRQADRLMVIIPPEGTRSQARRWKTGFYHIARGAQVPIILGFLDYERKVGGLGEVFWPTEDLAADADRINSFYREIKGKNSHLFTPIKLAEQGALPVPGAP